MKRIVGVILLLVAILAASPVADAGWCKDCVYMGDFAACALTSYSGWRYCDDGSYGICGPWGCIAVCRLSNYCAGAV